MNPEKFDYSEGFELEIDPCGTQYYQIYVLNESDVLLRKVRIRIISKTKIEDTGLSPFLFVVSNTCMNVDICRNMILFNSASELETTFNPGQRVMGNAYIQFELRNLSNYKVKTQVNVWGIKVGRA